PRRIDVPLNLATQSSCAGELWQVDGPVECDQRDGVVACLAAQVAMFHACVAEGDLRIALESAVADVYGRVLEALRRTGFGYPLRVWNYLSAINDGVGDAERYRRFCVGRYRALPVIAGIERLLPAATAIGGPPDSGLTLYVLAARKPGLQIENPRQLSAYRYPRDYGQRSPSFSRATAASWRDGDSLFVSGTASILGHRTVHAGDVRAQLRQAFANIYAVRVQAARQTRRGPLPLRRCTVYVRHAEEVALLLDLLRDYLGMVQPRILIGDVCRRDLSVEVEAVCDSLG
ncbi:MAG TPA: hypothetical protein VFQ88_16375, partial [Nevskiaceae bacterium]|nr:hypothetical protein [Nevskiaceae bacterium]